jgi:peroxiredoxin
MTLRDDLAALKAKSAERMPAQVRELFAACTRGLKQRGIEDRSRKAGERAPAFRLPNVDGRTVDSGDLLAEGPLVVSFYRGGWCPYCNMELRALQRELPNIRDLGARLVAISPELPEKGAETKTGAELDFEVLSDVGNKVARSFGLVFAVPEELRPVYARLGLDLPNHNGDDSFELPVPATYVVDGDGTILHAFVDADYTARLEPEEIVAALRRAENAPAESNPTHETKGATQ